jgi:F-type H+-transporting ATPase subunit b
LRIVAIALILVLIATFAFGAEPAHESEGGAKFLGLPTWIWKFINMVAFLALLVWLLKGPVKSAIASRHESIRREAVEAQERRARSEQMASEISARLAKLEEDVKTIRERAQSEGERQKREMIAAAEAESKKILQGARNEVESRLKAARQELTEYAGELASQRAEQLLREKITDADRDKLFRDSLSEIERVRS